MSKYPGFVRFSRSKNPNCRLNSTTRYFLNSSSLHKLFQFLAFSFSSLCCPLIGSWGGPIRALNVSIALMLVKRILFHLNMSLYLAEIIFYINGVQHQFCIPIQENSWFNIPLWFFKNFIRNFRNIIIAFVR